MKSYIFAVFATAATLFFCGNDLAQTTAKKYADKTFHFSIEYPNDFKVLRRAAAKSDTAFGDPGEGVKLVSVTPARIPTRYHGFYEFSVWRDASPKRKCGPIEATTDSEVPLEAPADGPKTRVIDGHTLYAYTGGDGGMSKELGLTGYRGMVDGKCWQIQSMTYQVSAFDDFKNFDEKIIDRAFEKFVASFRF